MNMVPKALDRFCLSGHNVVRVSTSVLLKEEKTNNSGGKDRSVQSNDSFEISLIDGSGGSRQTTGWDDEDEGASGEEGED